MTAAHPMDPSGTAVHAEAGALREAAAACPVLLPGGVPGMIVSRYKELRDFLADPKVAKSARHFAAYQQGRVPEQWQLNAFALVDGMTTADGDDHRRLRGLATKAFTPRRVAAMRPWIGRLAGELLAALPGHRDGDGVVDLRLHFAYPLPMGVISELLGVDAAYRDELHELVRVLVSTSSPAADAMAAQARIHAVLARVVADRRARPGEDLTSALIAARDDALNGGAERLSDAELTGTLLLMIVAGHETTLNLITNAVRALSGHPEQLALVLAGRASWDAVVEETLRWDSPVANFPFRYPTTDIEVDGVTVPRGTPVLAGYAAAGRDRREYGPDADRFDVTRPAGRHLSFGHGAHYCLGAPLARLEAVIALRELYAAHPGLTVAVPDGSLPPLPGFVGNGVTELPVRLG
ncbi:cytochrome P450 family protein [Actinacidiphila sp. ITFR-21]|uniref:cytochrome P450 family protein n=1 Tax=Actinacidiphila sp. ITFR-21 TaxID=3075199 RepID=UPI00288C42FB|nr:cytochrome P450 [Streptomyces sp. ITFR-21]WNI16853.1 cytochrome P450 [Streptomyces sp. ITFR-21]